MKNKNEVWGYCRISTRQQSIKRQIDNITDLYKDARIIEETYTGTKVQGREKWNKLFNRVKEGDKIVFDSVSRMSRNAEEGVEQYMDLFDRGVELEFIKEPHINTATYRSQIDTQMINKAFEGMEGGLILPIKTFITDIIKALAKEQIIIAFNQAEKEVMDLRQRTVEGIEKARAKADLEKVKKRFGRQVGEKVTTKISVEAKEQIKKLSKDFLGSNTDKEVIAIAKISRNTYYKYKKELVAELQAEQDNK